MVQIAGDCELCQKMEQHAKELEPWGPVSEDTESWESTEAVTLDNDEHHTGCDEDILVDGSESSVADDDCVTASSEDDEGISRYEEVVTENRPEEKIISEWFVADIEDFQEVSKVVVHGRNLSIYA